MAQPSVCASAPVRNWRSLYRAAKRKKRPARRAALTDKDFAALRAELEQAMQQGRKPTIATRGRKPSPKRCDCGRGIAPESRHLQCSPCRRNVVVRYCTPCESMGRITVLPKKKRVCDDCLTFRQQIADATPCDTAGCRTHRAPKCRYCRACLKRRQRARRAA